MASGSSSGREREARLGIFENVYTNHLHAIDSAGNVEQYFHLMIQSDVLRSMKTFFNAP
jgi:hypothetical protein